MASRFQNVGQWWNKTADGLRQRAERNGYFILMSRAILGFGLHDLSGSAGSVAYFTFFSIFPLLLGLIALFGYVLGTETSREIVLGVLTGVLPVSQDLIAQNIDAAIQARGFIGIISVLILLWSATGVFSSITVALNRAWNVPEGRPFVRQKLLELGMILTIGLLLILSLLVTAVPRLISQIGIALPGPDFFSQYRLLGVLTELISLFLSFLVFLAIYRILPNRKVNLNCVYLPALLVALAFEIAKSLFGWYVASFANYQLVFGSLGAVVALLFWTYLSALVLLFGAELSAHYGTMRDIAVSSKRLALVEPLAVHPAIVESGSAVFEPSRFPSSTARLAIISFALSIFAVIAFIGKKARRK